MIEKRIVISRKHKVVLISLIWVVCGVLLLVLAGAASLVGISEYVRLSTDGKIYSDANELSDVGEVDCVLVLGAGLKSDGTPSHMLEDRVKVAVEVYNATGANDILMSGDRSGDDYDEPAAMKKYAEELGVDPSHILIDECGFSTYESIKRTEDLFDFDNIIIITQKYHLHRALYISNDAEFDALGVSADLRTYQGQVVRDLREILARVKDFFMCM